MIVAIDPGYTNLGYAVGEEGKLYEYGTVYLKSKDRLKEIYKKVSDLFKKYKPSLVLVEDFRVYRGELRGKHKTGLAIGVISAVAYEHGAEVRFVNHKSWKAEFQRVYPIVEPRLGDDWREGLRKGSEHSRDAVMMLLPKVVSLKSLLVGGKK